MYVRVWESVRNLWGPQEPSFGLASDGKKRWCAECAQSKGAMLVRPRKKCEECKVKVRYRPNAKSCPLLCVGICA
jgi:hypothetical protein